MNKQIITLLLNLSLSGSILLSINACAVVSQQQGPLQTTAQLSTNADLFLNAFYQGKTEGVLAQSGFPFYVHGQAILDSAPEWEMMLQGLFLSSKPAPIEIISLAQVSPASIELKQPGIWAKLLEYGFHEKAYTIAVIQVNSSRPVKETVLLIQNPYSGKILGLAR